MIIDVVSPRAYGQYNIKFVQITKNPLLGVYMGLLIEILKKVFDKQTYDDETYLWKLDRKYVTEKTAIEIADQKNLDKILIDMGILEYGETTNHIKINTVIYLEYLLGNRTMPELKVEQPKETKKSGAIFTLKSAIKEPDAELHHAYEEWLNVVFGKKCTAVCQVTKFIDDVNRLATNKNDKLKIIQTATQCGWMNAEWCCKPKSANFSTDKTNTILPEQKISNGDVSTEVSY